MKRARQCAIVLALLLAAASVAPGILGATPDDCHALRKHGHRAEAQACYQSLTQTRDPYLRAEGDWGLEHVRGSEQRISRGSGAVG